MQLAAVAAGTKIRFFSAAGAIPFPKKPGDRLDSVLCRTARIASSMSKVPPRRSAVSSKPRPAAAKKPAGEWRPPRLQQVLASAGLGSRRQCETLITEGRVEVDGVVADQLGTRVDPSSQKVLVDGEPLRLERPQYFMVNKPPGVVSTSADPSGRLRVIDLIKTDARVYNVGRLDRTSEGLIIVTNDGELANRLTHPSFQIEKRYLVEVAGSPPREQLEQLEKGVHLAEGVAKASRVEARRSTRRGTILEITLREGRNREIRRLMASVGHKVLRLKRIAIGPIVLGELGAGESRKLTPEEVAMLKGLAGRPASAGASTGRRKKDITEQIMLSDFRGHAKRAARRRVEQAKPVAGESAGRAVTRQRPVPGTTGAGSQAAEPPTERGRQRRVPGKSGRPAPGRRDRGSAGATPRSVTPGRRGPAGRGRSDRGSRRDGQERGLGGRIRQSSGDSRRGESRNPAAGSSRGTERRARSGKPAPRAGRKKD